MKAGDKFLYKDTNETYEVQIVRVIQSIKFPKKGDYVRVLDESSRFFGQELEVLTNKTMFGSLLLKHSNGADLIDVEKCELVNNIAG